MPSVERDFDGNGMTDRAIVLVADRGEPLALFVFLKSRDGKWRDFKVEERSTQLGEYHITVVPKGCYHSEETGARVVCLKHDGLAYTELEYGGGRLHWFDGKRWRELLYTRRMFKELQL